MVVGSPITFDFV